MEVFVVSDNPSSALSLYIHIPFCKQRCLYCSFFSSENNSHLASLYIESIKKECLQRLNGNSIKTIYIGGGTPSYLPKEVFEALVNFILTLPVSNVVESTVEVNPESFSEVFLKQIQRLPNSRISVGIQSMNDKTLVEIGRPCSVAQIKQTLFMLKEFSIKNISYDFIVGLPHERRVSESIESAFSIYMPNHVSLYMLEIGEKPSLLRNWESILQSDDEACDNYADASNLLYGSGFSRYEISNYCRGDFHSHHNSAYWGGECYVGVGAGAFGYDGVRRYRNVCDVSRYIETVDSLLCEDFSEIVDINILRRERLFLPLRTRRGLYIKGYCEAFGIDESLFSDIAEKYTNYFMCKDGFIGFTDEGFLLSDSLVVEILSIIEG